MKTMSADPPCPVAHSITNVVFALTWIEGYENCERVRHGLTVLALLRARLGIPRSQLCADASEARMPSAAATPPRRRPPPARATPATRAMPTASAHSPLRRVDCLRATGGTTSVRRVDLDRWLGQRLGSPPAPWPAGGARSAVRPAVGSHGASPVALASSRRPDCSLHGHSRRPSSSELLDSASHAAVTPTVRAGHVSSSR